jgi:cell wall-associated NlpC family hydrolase
VSGSAGAVVAYAYNQLGRPYVWGGTGGSGFDCSGLTMRAYARAGVRLPHRAAEQSGRTVSLAQARPGDLVKWGSYHVGVYVGHGYVIHAPKPGDHVKKSRLWGSYRIVRVL